MLTSYQHTRGEITITSLDDIPKEAMAVAVAVAVESKTVPSEVSSLVDVYRDNSRDLGMI
jgi:hypothetical protein